MMSAAPQVFSRLLVQGIWRPIICISSHSLLESIWQKMTFFRSGRKFSKQILNRSAMRMFLCAMELAGHDYFIREFGLPDTFNSWFRVSELHIWMLLVRLAREGKDGVFCRRFIVEYLWKDIDTKTKKLGKLATLTARKEGVLMMSEQFKAALFAYDEGLLDDDKALAGAIWRSFFQKNCDEAAHLELMVEYVHKQIAHLDRIPSEDLLKNGIVKFLPLFDTPEVQARNEHILAEILKRSK